MTGDSHALVGAYLLDALEDHERVEFDAHRRACPDCEHATRELRTVILCLANAVSTPPPRELRDRVLTAISHTRQHGRLRTALAARRRPRR